MKPFSNNTNKMNHLNILNINIHIFSIIRNNIKKHILYSNLNNNTNKMNHF